MSFLRIPHLCGFKGTPNGHTQVGLLLLRLCKQLLSMPRTSNKNPRGYMWFLFWKLVPPLLGCFFFPVKPKRTPCHFWGSPKNPRAAFRGCDPEAQVISPACGAVFSARSSSQPLQNLVEPWWNPRATLVEPYLRAAPDHPGAYLG